MTPLLLLLIAFYPATSRSHDIGYPYPPSIQMFYSAPLDYYPEPTPVKALCVLDGPDSITGVVSFLQPHPASGPTIITGNITGLAPGKHGFHIHINGDIRNGCAFAGSHYNPFEGHHAGPADACRHVGDLGNIEADPDGEVQLQMSDHMVQLAGPYSVLGRSVVVHEKADDLGRGGNADSLKTGNAGARLACCIIGFVE